jgi:hypothetical protein
MGDSGDCHHRELDRLQCRLARRLRAGQAAALNVSIADFVTLQVMENHMHVLLAMLAGSLVGGTIGLVIGVRIVRRVMRT